MITVFFFFSFFLFIYFLKYSKRVTVNDNMAAKICHQDFSGATILRILYKFKNKFISEYVAPIFSYIL